MYQKYLKLSTKSTEDYLIHCCKYAMNGLERVKCVLGSVLLFFFFNKFCDQR